MGSLPGAAGQKIVADGAPAFDAPENFFSGDGVIAFDNNNEFHFIAKEGRNISVICGAVGTVPNPENSVCVRTARLIYAQTKPR